MAFANPHQYFYGFSLKDYVFLLNAPLKMGVLHMSAVNLVRTVALLRSRKHLSGI